MSQLIPSTTPLRTFEDHTDVIHAVAVFPDRRRMITGSRDKTLRLWDLETGVILKKMVGHHEMVRTFAISRDGQFIASGGWSGELIAWHGETGKPLQAIGTAHPERILTLDFSPNGTVLVTASSDRTAKLWNTKTWHWVQGNQLHCMGIVRSVRYSPDGEILAVATNGDINIFNCGTRERVAEFKGHTGRNFCLAWTPGGTRLLSAGDQKDPTIREWDPSTWMQVGDPWTGHTHTVHAIAVNPGGTLVASASEDNDVRLWRLSDRQIIAIFQHSDCALCVTFSMDGKHILSGGNDKMISEWEVPDSELAQESNQILAINATARNAFIAGDLSTAEQLLTQEIDTDINNHTSYANRSLVMARMHHWDHALQDAIKSVTIQPSLTGYISKGIALCGKGKLGDARKELDLAFIFTNEDPKTIRFLLLIKAIVIFNADQHEEAILRIRKLADACPNNDTLACRVVEAYLHVQLGINALNGARYDEATDYFTAAVKSSTFSSNLDIHLIYEDLVMLFGWNLKSLWQNAHQKLCNALRQGGKLEEALGSFREMMNIIDETTKARCFAWSIAFRQDCSAFYLPKGDAAFTASNYDKAIDLYSVVIDLDFANDTVFANRSKARSEKMLWEDALLDAQKVIELNPSSHIGYQLKHKALHGAQRYNQAIRAFEVMLTKLDSAHDMQIRKLREHYISPSEVERDIRKSVDVQLDVTPRPVRLFNTTTGLLCDREGQLHAFKTSKEYNELLLSLTMKYADLRMERITEVVATYFRCAMLSHRWEGREPLLHDIKDKVVYQLKAASGLVKLQSFCEIVRKAGLHWAWVDSCCIDQQNNVEVQKSLNSMFAWYHHAALTIVYLSDVPHSSKSSALAKSAWNTRGWTVPEFLAPKVILFYQQDWTLYLDDHSPNHKESVEIMRELQDATGIDARALVAFQPGMRDAREKLQWASKRATTVPEDIAYSLFGIFRIQLPILYGENQQNALGRLLQEIVARSGDITALDWVGESSEFNSCLPANIVSYAAPPCTLPSLHEDEIQTAVSSLRNTVAADLALKLYTQLDKMSAPRFANCRLRLPCIAFWVTAQVRQGHGPVQEPAHFTYGVKADGLHDLEITTKDTLIQFVRPTLQTFLLVRPWNRCLLGLPDFAELHDFGDNTQSEDEDRTMPGSSVEQEPVDSESHSRALRLIARLGQPFSAFLLAQQHSGEYKRIASDCTIIAQIRDVASIHNMMDVRTLEIL
ncbi:hypothetical protein BDR05DRAFT_991937 [Suillus weaverae]|nr:hypothetical protein BDR05DRAFT_991937 [Suillus weaverae]